MRYARIHDGQPVEIIEPFYNDDGVEVPIAERFTSELVETMVEWPDGEPLPTQGLPEG